MARKQKTLPEVEDASFDGIPEKARGRKLATEEGWQEVHQEKRFRTMSPHLRQRPVGEVPTTTEFRHQVSRENRLARYEAVHALRLQAHSESEIARRLTLSRPTVHKFLRAETFPERQEQAYRGSILDPYKPYILERWQAGCWNGTQLYEEVRKRGYTGSASFFRRFIAELRKKHRLAGDSAVLALDPLSATNVTIPEGVDPPPQVKARLSATRASWLCVSQPTKPDERHLQQLELLRHAHPDFEKAYQLSQEFVSMLKKRRGEDLDAWLNRAEQSGIAEIQSFAQGLRRDDSAVHAAFSSPWSNGQVEAQVNCLKLQKRMAFGRANFDLLRLRVLCRV